MIRHYRDGSSCALALTKAITEIYQARADDPVKDSNPVGVYVGLLLLRPSGINNAVSLWPTGLRIRTLVRRARTCLSYQHDVRNNHTNNFPEAGDGRAHRQGRIQGIADEAARKELLRIFLVN